EGRDGDQVQVVRQLRSGPQVGDLEILDFEALRRHAGDREQREAGQRGDDLGPLYEARQREAHFHELRVNGAHAAHSDESDLQDNPHPTRSETTPSNRLMTGTGKSARSWSRQAARKQTSGMAPAPTMKLSDAISRQGAPMGTA